MTRHVAFLRGINLGKRRMKMDQLRRHVEELGLDNVATFIASGNVVFDYSGSDLGRLEGEIETHLEDAFGFFADTFVRPLGGLDKFNVLGREVVWVRRGGLSESSITAHDLEKALGGMKNTMRKLNTIQRIVAKFGE